MNRLTFENTPLDSVDRALLDALWRDARTSTAELARLVGMSPPSTAERIRRLEEAGVIRGYGARIDPVALGYGLAAWIRIRPMPGQLPKVIEVIQDCPEISTCDRVTGEDCFLARAHVRAILDLERLIDRLLPYAMTNTALIQSTPVTERPPPFNGTRA